MGGPKKTSERDFVNLVKTLEKVEGILVDEEVILGPTNAPSFYRKEFSNCTLSRFKIACSFGEVRFINCDIELLVIDAFANSEQKILIKNCTINDVKISSKSNKTLEELKFEGKITINTISFDCGIKEVHIASSTLLLDRLIFQYVIKLAISSSSGLKNIIVRGRILETIISNCTNLKLSFENSEIGQFRALGNEDTELYFSETISKTIDFTFNKRLAISLFSIECDQIELASGSCNLLRFTGIGKYRFVTQTLPAAHVEATIIEFSNFTLQPNSQIILHDLKTQFIQFANFDNQGLLKIGNAIIMQELSMVLSDFRKSTFNNVTLTPKCQFKLLNSEITDVTFTNFKWNNSYKLAETSYESNAEFPLSPVIALREAYRQLKANYIKNNNKIEALEFQKHEMRVHFELLKQELKHTKTWRTIGNFLIVGSNKLFSDFGQNIWKPFILLFLVNFVLFNALLFFTPELKYGLGWPIEWEATKKGIGLYFQTLLPTHASTTKNYFNKDVSIAGFWDFLIRVFSGYFIFYFISASRKYHQ